MKQPLIALALVAGLACSQPVLAGEDAEMAPRLLRNMESVGRMFQKSTQCGVKPADLPGTAAAHAQSYQFARTSKVVRKEQLDAAYAQGVQRAVDEGSSMLRCWHWRWRVTSLDGKQADIAAALKELTRMWTSQDGR